MVFRFPFHAPHSGGQQIFFARQSRTKGIVAKGILATTLLLGTTLFPSLSPACARPVQIPFQPTTTPASHRILPGKVVYAMLVTPDLASAQNFYGQLFGWRFRPVGSSKTQRAEITIGQRSIGSLVQHPLDAHRHDVPFWIPFISTSDTHAIARATRHMGGKVLFGPRVIPGLGEEVVLSDPQHGVFAALASEAGDLPDPETQPNDFSWSTLLTPQPRESAGFYQTLFSYQVSAAPENADGTHFFLSSQETERASINTPPKTDEQHDTARWIRFVTVTDIGAASDRATRLGGHVLVPSHPDRDGAYVAILTDPTGAVFGLLQAQSDDRTGGNVQ